MTGIVRTGEVHLAAPPEEAFEMFTPEGERHWAHGWDPHWLQPAGGGFEAGAIFRTGNGGEETTWVILDADRARRYVRYARITPGSRLGTVEVRCAPADAGTTAQVTYRLSALSTAGEQVLAGMTPERYEEMIASWQRDIARALEERERKPVRSSALL
jgi:polyketide cyclase/dehydrase/lipid transport protein